MKTSSGFSRWGPAAGVLALGLMAFSLSLEGATPQQPAPLLEKKPAETGREVIEARKESLEAALEKTTTTPRVNQRGEVVMSLGAVDPEQRAALKFGRLPKGEVPVEPPQVVDYRDDEGTRLRQAGLLVGPYRPALGAVAGGACSFDIECDDCDPCTLDHCDISVGDPLNSGTCVHQALANGAEGECSDGVCCNGRETCQAGVCQTPGTGTGVFDPNVCEYPCSGGQICDENNNLCRPACDGTAFCAVDGLPCATTLDCDQTDPDNFCKNCNDGVRCNGTETCVAGVCEPGTNPCGPGAVCGERDCSNPGVQICTSDSDCAEIQAGTCTVLGPICQHGRCCVNTTAEPVCTKRSKAQCDGAGGVWYPTDAGFLGTPGGTICPTPAQQDPPNDRTLCPKYSGGIAPPANFDTEAAFFVGPFSNSPCDQDEIGDDYEFENGSVLALEKFRWMGAGGGRLVIEFYDQNGNFVEDIISGGVGGNTAIRSLQFIPPLVIPHKGFVVVRVALNFAPNGRTFLVATDNVDEGLNLAAGANSLWFNGVPSSLTLRECVGGTNDGAWCNPSDPGDSECVGGGGVCQNRNNRLAFELEGLKDSPPAGACCDDATGTCANNVLSWVCAGAGDSFQGEGSLCAACAGGVNVGMYCRSCSNNLAMACNTNADCPGGTCIPDNGDCPGSTCTALAGCGEGACCHANGTCDELPQGSCNAPGDMFQGFGTDCDPNCCEQPVFSGGDNCEDATVHNISVPPVGDPPTVVTITGNNSTASGPDSCEQGAWNAIGGTYLTVDPGWWEGFTIDDCAFVRIDFCCSDPVVEPAWALMATACPCGADPFVFPQANPNSPGEPANRRGGPYCEDDNLWQWFGPLPAGDYYYPVYSVPPGANDQYQMHISVYACPDAACCDGTACSEVNQLECAAQEANFLAPPFRSVATTTCQASTCATGSCCYSPSGATCEDIIAGALATPASCANIAGEYRGGARCRGGVCTAGTPPASCSTNDDCGLNGPCIGGDEDLAQPSPCPVCEHESKVNCQLHDPAPSVGFFLSDDCAGNCVSDPPVSNNGIAAARIADDFVADAGGMLTEVCIVGGFLQQGGLGLPNCNPALGPEKFTVILMSDAGGAPGPEIGSSATTVIRRGERGEGAGGRTKYQYQLSLLSPFNITQGNTYWIAVVNSTDESSGHPDCDWFWYHSDPQDVPDKGNDYYYWDFGVGFTQTDADFGEDFSLCLNIANSVPPNQERACCTCEGGVGVCTESSLELCVQSDGDWDFTEPDCIGVNCRDGADAGDFCSAPVAVTTNSSTAWNNFCTDTDGPLVAAVGGDCAGGQDLQNDIWFEYVADCDSEVIVETCDNNSEFDTVMAIYSNGTGACPCPIDSSTQVDCNDDGCVFAGLGSRTSLPVTSGTCYLIRVGGFLGSKGEGFLHIGACGPVDGGPPAVLPDPTGLNKVRFISFIVPAANVAGLAAETALRVVLTSLHHVNPPYAGGPSIPFTAFEGQVRWVGPPTQYVESTSVPITFYASALQCTPHYRDWSTVTSQGINGLLHVTGSAITPSSIYHVENVAAACQGLEGTAPCLSGGANVSPQLQITTTRWCDIIAPFNPPDPSEQPNFGDVNSLVDKFKSALGAPIKARALVTGANAFGDINIAPDLGFNHIASCVDAFRGLPYPYQISACP